jgi:hypothetical protein
VKLTGSTPANGAIAFESGGIDASSGDALPRWLALPEERLPPTAFTPRAPTILQTLATEDITLRRATETGLVTLGTVIVPGGPAQLIERDRKLYQFAPNADGSFSLREYELAEPSISTGTLRAARQIRVPSLDDEAQLIGFSVDVDPWTGDVVLLEKREGESAALRPRTLRWFRWLGEEMDLMAELELGPGDDGVVAFVGGTLLVFETGKVTSHRMSEGTLVSSVRTHEQGVHRLLATDGRVVYVSGMRDNRSELSVFDADGVLRSVTTLPGEALSVARAGDALVVATNSSVHRLTPTCGDVTPTEPAPWPILDATDWEPPPKDCRPITPCRPWEAPAQAGDVNRDGCVDVVDVGIAARCAGVAVDECRESILADLNGNGKSDDYPAVLANLGKGCPP